MTYTLCKPTLKHHQYKHHQQHKSLNINPILTRCRDDHPAIVTPSHAKATYTNQIHANQPKRVIHHGTYTLQTNTFAYTYTNQIQADQIEPTIITHAHCKPTFKYHQYKHHQQHKSININPIHTRCRDDYPAVRRASTCKSHIHKSNTNNQPKRVNHHGTYTLSCHHASTTPPPPPPSPPSPSCKARHHTTLPPHHPATVAYTLCIPTLKHHQYKHHQQRISININSILTACSDDHPAVRHANTCETHIHKSNTTQPKRANHHGTYTLHTNAQIPSI